MNTLILGIDIAKRTFDVCLLRIDPDTQKEQQFHKHFDNSPQGFTKLTRFLRAHSLQQELHQQATASVHACMEATGTYGDALARFLYQQGYRVSIVNAARINAYAASLISRTKSDKADARVIALFCKAHQPEPWNPPAPEVAALQELVRHVDALVRDRQQQLNRLEDQTLCQPVRQSLEVIVRTFDEQIKRLKKQIADHFDQHPGLRQQRDLLTSIPGIGSLTAAKVLAEIVEHRRYARAQKLVAYAGLSPAPRQSGSSLRTRGHLSKKGSTRLRTALYMPALVALKHNPVVLALKERLHARGKRPMEIVAAAMRKLLILAYGVLKSGRPFDPNFALDNA